MKKNTLLLLLLLSSQLLWCQRDFPSYFNERKACVAALDYQNYQSFAGAFQKAYVLYPSVPRGILEAVAYTHSRFTHLIPDTVSDSPEQMPLSYGVMGLVKNGKGVFRENMKYISLLSGISESEIKRSPQASVMAYASAYSALQSSRTNQKDSLLDFVSIIQSLSELPDGNEYQFARLSELYEICMFLNNEIYREMYGIKIPRVSMEMVFGDWLPLLGAANVQFQSDYPKNSEDLNGNATDIAVKGMYGADYVGARWVPAGSCNYSSRNGMAISSVAIHYTQGTYAGSIAWFQNCSYNGVGAQVSAHYVIRSSDGQITQMVREADKAWHVGNANGYTIGIEHEAYGDIKSYFTPEMYQASADLTRDICHRHQIPTHRVFYRDTLDDGTVLNSGLHNLGSSTACTKIRGHQHYPSQTHTDPGPYWDWNYYYKLINNATPVTTLTSSAGTFTDSGGERENYGDDERQLVLIQVEDADYITLDFQEFSLESNYDFMWIYDGNSVFSPLIGRWNTSSPGTIVSSGNALLVEFRSDCATNASGWVASWTAHFPNISVHPSTEILFDEDEWVTDNVEVRFRDGASNPIAYRFYQVMGNDGVRWTANQQKGFLADNFDDFNQETWRVESGRWQVADHCLRQLGTGDAVLKTLFCDRSGDAYLYDFYVNYHSSGASVKDPCFGMIFHMNQSLNGTVSTAYKFVVYPLAKRIKICKVSRGVTTVLASFEHINTNVNTNYLYRIVYDKSGTILCFRDGVLIGKCQDVQPIGTMGNFFAFTTHGIVADFDNVRIYRSREASAEISVGDMSTSDAPWQARGGVAKTKIKSVIMDVRYQWSPLEEKLMKIDFTPPLLFGPVIDGVGADMDYTYSNLLAAHWPAAFDPNSAISYYYYSLAFRQGDNEITACRDYFCMDTTYFHSMILNQSTNYYAKVRAVNEAGLVSNTIFSDGFVYKPFIISLPWKKSQSVQIRMFPNPVVDRLHVNIEINEKEVMQESISVKIYDMLGKLILEETLFETQGEIDVHVLKAGVYMVAVYWGNELLVREKFIKRE